AFMLNLDMVGRMKDDTIEVGGTGTAPAFDPIVTKAAAKAHLKTKNIGKGGLGPSDHMAFALKKIPVLFFFTGLHKDYHRPTDTVDKVNFDGLQAVVDLGERVVQGLIRMPRQEYVSKYDSTAMARVASGTGGPGMGKAPLG